MTALRFHIEPLDVPAHAAARRLGLSLAAFTLALDDLISRGFPAADPTTGNYDIEAIDAWRHSRHSGAAPATAQDARNPAVKAKMREAISQL